MFFFQLLLESPKDQIHATPHLVAQMLCALIEMELPLVDVLRNTLAIRTLHAGRSALLMQNVHPTKLVRGKNVLTLAPDCVVLMLIVESLTISPHVHAMRDILEIHFHLVD